MKSPIFALQWLLPILLIIQVMYSDSVSATSIHPLGRGMRSVGRILSQSAGIDKDLHTFYYNQTLDHFNYRPESYTTFPQRYFMSRKYWGGAKVNAPILAYLGAEMSVEEELKAVGFLKENAPKLKALQLYIEHRYYGKSIPFGSREEAFKNRSTMGYFNSAQAMADYAEILIHIKEKFNAKDSPVIVMGGSYGGMLASWFRLKYPHVAIGALASSAPILYHDDITPHDGYASVATRYYKEASQRCVDTIKKSWTEIDRIASKPNGLSILNKKFKTCKPLSDTKELKEYLTVTYGHSAQSSSPLSPNVKQICQNIDGLSSKYDILDTIFAAVVETTAGKKPCYVNNPIKSEMEVGWGWQTCSDIVFPIDSGNNTIFQPGFYSPNGSLRDCQKKYGVPARPHWWSTYYGGHDIKLVLKRFGSNIIFSNGMRDPWSIGGVLENISESIIALNTVEGSHCLDLRHSIKDEPAWLKEQKQTEVKIIRSWFAQYYADLRAYRNGKSF